MSNPTPAEIYTRASEIITERGWAQRRSVDDQGRVCIMEAIDRANTELGGYSISMSVAVDKLHDHLRTTTGITYGFVCYNDQNTTSEEDIHQLLKTAAQQ